MSNAQKFDNPPAVIEDRSGASPESLPIVDTGETFCDKARPELKEGVIVHYLHESSQVIGSRSHVFELLREIDAMHYVFDLTQTYGKTYEFRFHTKEYGYAATNLSEEGQRVLEKTIRVFLETIKGRKDIIITEVDIDPADEGCSVRDIEDCIEEIVVNPNNTLSREEILEKHNGTKTFALYQDLYGKAFKLKHDSSRKLAKARSRYFKSMFRRILPGWQVSEGKRFSLKKEPE